MNAIDDMVDERRSTRPKRRKRTRETAEQCFAYFYGPVKQDEDHGDLLIYGAPCKLEVEWPDTEVKSGYCLRDQTAVRGPELAGSIWGLREVRNFSQSALPRSIAPEMLFDQLAEEWKAGRGHSSKIKDLAMHPAYQRIIGMGDLAIPLILEEMRRSPGQWTWALRAITGADPVPAESRGKLKEMTAAWISWGIEKGYIE